MRSRNKPGVGVGGKRSEWKNKGGREGEMLGSPGRGGVDWEVKLPTALNQLPPVPANLSGIRGAEGGWEEEDWLRGL